MATYVPPVLSASVTDDSGRTWTGLGPTMRDAYNELLDQLEKAAGQASVAANIFLGVFEAPPNRPSLKKRGPAQGSL